MMTFVGIGVSILVLVLARLCWESIKRAMRPSVGDLRGELVSIRIQIGTGSIGCERCVIRNITRESGMNDIIRTEIQAEAMNSMER